MEFYLWPACIFLGFCAAVFAACRLVSFFREAKSTPILPDQVIDDDPNVREVCARALNSGKVVIGRIDDNGNLTMEECD